MTDSADIRQLFPCKAVPDEASTARLLGLYPQRQEGLFMQRVKIPGGRLTGEQWRALASIARVQTPATPLHLTTRQDIELHDLPAERVPAAQAALAEVALSTVGACGDTPRNVTVCPCGSAELLALAGQIRQTLADQQGVYALPRKFKIALACSDSCGQPWINDLGMVAVRKDGQWGFTVMAAGSLGAKPGTGMKLYDWLPAERVIPLAVAAVRVFAAEGDRENRRRARLRHVRERIGDEALAELIAKELTTACEQGGWPAVSLSDATTNMPARAMLTFVNGDITPAQADVLGAIESADDTTVRIGNHHQVMVLATDQSALDRAAGTPALADARRRQGVVVACPGRRWCSRGLTDTNAMADRVRSELGSQLPAGAIVCISGCPNGCSHAAVADIGLFGGRAGGDDGPREVYNLLAGGGMGRDDRLARMVQTKISADDVVQRIAELLNESA